MFRIGDCARSFVSTIRSTLNVGGGSAVKSFSEVLKDTYNTNETPSIKKVPSTIHHFWYGDTAVLRGYADNLIATAKMNKGYSVVLHVLSADKGDLKRLKKELVGVKVKDAVQEKWFSKFKSSERYHQFVEAMSAEVRCFASGADVIKSEILQRKGGVWNDVDNIPLKPLPKKLVVEKGGMLTAGPVLFNRQNGECGVHSSTLATHKNNSIVKDINKCSFSKFKNLEGVVYKQNEKTRDASAHFLKMSEIAGSLHFSRELMGRSKCFEREILELRIGKQSSNDLHVIFDRFFQPVFSSSTVWKNQQSRSK